MFVIVTRKWLINNYLLTYFLLHIMDNNVKEKYTVEQIKNAPKAEGKEKPSLPWKSDEEYNKVEPPYED